MKVVCKNNDKNVIDDEDDYELSIHKNIIEQYKGGGGDHLIEGKIYEVYNIDIDTNLNLDGITYYYIENESNQKFWYSANRFKTIEENREDILNELGI